MAGRPNTLVCSFDPASPRINAWDIHEWINDALRIPEQDVQLIQIDGIRRQVFIKLPTSEHVIKIVRDTNGRIEYKYPSGEIFHVNIDLAGIGTKRIRVANLPPEVHDEVLKVALQPYGKVLNVSGESWSKAYRYQVPNGIRNVLIMMSKHVPANLTVAGNKTLISYEGQPITCYSCGQEGHVASTCTNRHRTPDEKRRPRPASYANVLTGTEPGDDIIVTGQHDENTNRVPQVNKYGKYSEDSPDTSQEKTIEQDERPSRGNDRDTLQHAPSQHIKPSLPEQGTGRNSEDIELMETETKQNTTADTENEGQQIRGVSKERKREMEKTATRETGSEGDGGDNGNNTDIQHMEDEQTNKHGKGTSPKPVKKMKMDKTLTHQQERSRSGTRRTQQKGK